MMISAEEGRESCKAAGRYDPSPPMEAESFPPKPHPIDF